MNKTAGKPARKVLGQPGSGEPVSVAASRLIDLIPEYEKIGGWLKLEEAELLFKAASTVHSGCILEVGSYRGRSTVALAAGSRCGPNTPVYAIEPHELFIGPQGGSYGPKDRRFFLQTLMHTKLFGIVRLLNVTSGVVAPGWDKQIGLLIIDGDHRYGAVLSDFVNWRPFLLDGATVIFNAAKAAGPSALIKELVEEGCLVPEAFIGNLMISRFRTLIPSIIKKSRWYKLVLARAAALLPSPAISSGLDDGPSSRLPDMTDIEPENIEHAATPPVYPAPVADSARNDNWQTLSSIGHGVYFGGNGSYLYQPIPKCGCTSVKTTLLELENLPVDPDEWRRHNKQHNRFPGTDHLPVAKQREIFKGKTNTFKFLIVRDPYTRMASAYVDKIVGGYKKNAYHWINQIKRTAEKLDLPLSDEITFDQFVRITAAQETRNMDPHWRQQFHAGYLDIIKFDFIGHLEMLSSDLLYVLERLKAPVALMHKVAKPHNVTGAGLAMWAQVSAENRRRFTKTFEIDFDTLHYPYRHQHSW